MSESDTCSGKSGIFLRFRRESVFNNVFRNDAVVQWYLVARYEVKQLPRAEGRRFKSN